VVLTASRGIDLHPARDARATDHHGDPHSGRIDRVTERTRWLDQDQQRSWRALLMGMTLLQDRLDADLRRLFDLSLPEYEILVRLSENEGQLRMAQLADAMAHSRSRVTHTISRMEKAGLVERSTSTVDGRGIVATITNKGMDLLRTAAPFHVTGVREYLLDLVAPEDFQAVGRVFDAVSDYLVGCHPNIEMRNPPAG
jgi:DNA-binding MarR family transcriptional regulator